MKPLRRPLVAALLAYLAGLLLCLRFPLPPRSAALVLATASVLVLIGRSDRRFGFTLVLLLFSTAGIFSGSHGARADRLDCRAYLRGDQRLEGSGILAAPHRPGGPSSPLLTVEAVRLASPACQVDIRVSLPRDVPAIPVGSTVRIGGLWRSFEPPRTIFPPRPDRLGYLRVDSVAVVTANAPPGAAWVARGAAEGAILELFPDRAPLVEALLLGRREYLDSEVRDRFARAGLAHLLAISGMHVGLIAGILFFAASLMGMSLRASTGAVLAALWSYLALIGAPLSAVRAAVMITIALLARLIQRPYAPEAGIAAAALLIVGLQPTSILDIGFQLSFAGVLSILFLRRPLLAALPGDFAASIPRSLLDGLIVGIAAFLGTAPIVAVHFGMVAPIGIIAGVPAVPLLALSLLGAILALCLHALSLPGAALIADGTGVFLDLLDRLAYFAAELPWANAEVEAPALVVVALVATFLGTRLVFRSTRPTIRVAVATSATVATLAAWPIVADPAAAAMEVHFLDVGQGDAIAIRTPGRHWLLIDAGPASEGFDAGEAIIGPFLRDRGSREIALLVLTHPDLDHIGGAPSLMRSMPVEHIFEPGAAVGRLPYLGVLEAARAEGAQWHAARSGRHVAIDGVEIDFLWPDSIPRALEDVNQVSAIVRIRYGDFSVLLTGDAGREVEAALVQRYGGELRSDVLKLGHHGSSTSTAPDFLSTVDPELTVVSAGRRNRYGHPHAEVIETVAGQGIAIARTDRDGTVSLRVGVGGEEWTRVVN